MKLKKVRTWYAREWIKYKRLKQADIVARTGYTKSMVSVYVNEKRRWNSDVITTFARVLGCDPQELLRPPGWYKNELADYVMAMEPRRQSRALKILKAMEDDNKDEVAPSPSDGPIARSKP